MEKQIAGVVLAAGKGSRMHTTTVNKVAYQIGEKPMIVYAVDLLEKLSISPIVMVVGFAKQSVMQVLSQAKVVYAEQKRRLGTAHALLCGLKKIPQEISDVLVMQGDDAFLYKAETIKRLIDKHIAISPAITFLTIELDNPKGLGRVLRSKEGRITGIVEEKDATQEQLQIREINPACYLFNRLFLNKYLKKIKKSPVTGEYYLTTLIDLAVQNNETLETITVKNMPWRGVNTMEELSEAKKLFSFGA